MQSVDSFHHKEHAKTDNQKCDESLNEVAPFQLRLPVERQFLAGHIEPAGDEPKNGHENVLHHRLDNLGERGSDHDPNCQIDDIPAKNELLELLKEGTHWQTPVGDETENGGHPAAERCEKRAEGRRLAEPRPSGRALQSLPDGRGSEGYFFVSMPGSGKSAFGVC